MRNINFQEGVTQKGYVSWCSSFDWSYIIWWWSDNKHVFCPGLKNFGNTGFPFWTSRSDTTCVTSIFRKEFLEDNTFSDAHLLIGVTSYDDELITYIFLVLVLKILKIRAFSFWSSRNGTTWVTSPFRKYFLKDYTVAYAHLLCGVTKDNEGHHYPL